MPPRNQHPSEIYAHEMLMLKEGHGLWFPEPHKTGMPQMGDVGFFTAGAFRRLFSLNSEEPEHVVISPRSGREFRFATFKTHYMEELPNALAPDIYPTSSVRRNAAKVGGTVSSAATISGGFVCDREQGAMLRLCSMADKQFFIPCSDVKDFIKRNYDLWHQYAVGEGFIPEKDIVIAFINGHVRTSGDWEVAAFQNRGSMYAMGVEAQAPGVGGVVASASTEHHVRSPVGHRSGPLIASSSIEQAGGPESSTTSDSRLAKDQTVFLKYYRVKRIRVFGIKRILAAAGPDDIDGDRTGDGEEIIIQHPDDDGDTAEPYFDDPLDVLLDYILESSDAATAIACLDDLYLLIPGPEWPADIKLYLQQMQPRIEVDNDKVGSIAPLDAIQRKRRRTMNVSMPTQIGPVDDGEAAPGSIVEGHMSPGYGPSAKTTLDWPHSMFRHKDAENGSVSCAIVSPNGKLLAVAWDDTVITVWALRDRSVVQQLQNPGHREAVWTLAFSPDSSHLVSGSADCRAIIWDLEERPGHVEEGQNQHILEKHTGHVMTVAYSPDGRFVATGAQDSLVCLWNAHNGDLVYTLEGHEYDITKVAFSPDGVHLASSSDSAVFIWNVETGAKIAELTAHEGAIWSFAFSPDGDRIITGSEDNSSRIWDVSSGTELVILHEHTDAVLAVAFSPDGNEVATGSHDAALVSCGSWDAGQRFVFDAQQSSPVEAVAYSHSGHFIASGYADGNIRLWDTKSGGSVAEYRGHEGKIRSVEFTAADEELVSSADDGTIRVWNVWDTLRVL